VISTASPMNDDLSRIAALFETNVRLSAGYLKSFEDPDRAVRRIAAMWQTMQQPSRELAKIRARQFEELIRDANVAGSLADKCFKRFSTSQWQRPLDGPFDDGHAGVLLTRLRCNDPIGSDAALCLGEAFLMHHLDEYMKCVGASDDKILCKLAVRVKTIKQTALDNCLVGSYVLEASRKASTTGKGSINQLGKVLKLDLRNFLWQVQRVLEASGVASEVLSTFLYDDSPTLDKTDLVLDPSRYQRGRPNQKPAVQQSANDDSVPLRHRSRPMTLTEAGVALHKQKGARASKKVLAAKVRRQIRSGELRAWASTRQKWYFDLRCIPDYALQRFQAVE
jgi:hypothetical protein